MEKEFIPYEQALDLKKFGFDEPCFYQYVRDFDDDGELIPITSETGYPTIRNNTQVSHYSGGDCFAAPTFSQAFRWFREKYDLHPSIESYNQDENGNDIEYTYTYCVVTNKNLPKEWNKFYNTYEQAELELLKKLIEIVKDGENR